jgi:hypothetical protein
MGINEDDIEHPRPESLSGGSYGQVQHYLKRKIGESGSGWPEMQLTD